MDFQEKARLNQLGQKINIMKGLQLSEDEITKSFDKEDLELVEKHFKPNIEKADEKEEKSLTPDIEKSIDSKELKVAKILAEYKSASKLTEEEIQKALENDIEKGEGDRGGKVIGHTKSGKPIYDQATHKSHKDFDHKDHKDAAEAHKKEEKDTEDEKAKKHHREEAAHHNSMSAVKDSHAVSMYNNWK